MTAAPPPTGRDALLAALLSRIARTDQRAFGELYELTSGHLHGVALRILGDQAAAEEILQEAYVSIWQYAGSYEAARSRPLTWLTSIVRNRCLDQLRRSEIDAAPMTGNEKLSPPGLPADPLARVETLPESADAISVRGCVDALEAGPRRAIELAFHRGLTRAELARQLHRPSGTVKSWVREALAGVKACLDRTGVSRTE